MEQLSVGDVLAISVRTFVGNLVPIVVAALLLTAVPAFLLQTVVVGPMIARGSVLMASGAGLISIALAMLLSTTISFCVVQSLAGRPVSMGDMLSRGLASVPVALGITVLFILLAIPSLFLLYIPMIIVACIWWVSIPVAVAEKIGVIEAIKRSASLTKGNRWRIFTLLLLYILVLLVMSALTLMLMLGGSGFSLAAIAQMSKNTAGMGTAGMIGSQIFSSLVSAFISVVVAVCYTELRRIKEGAGISEVARIFA